MSLSKRLFYNVLVTNGNLTANTISTNSTMTNIVLTNFTVSNTNITNTNVTNITGSNVNVSNVTGSNANITNIIGSNANITNITGSNLNITNITGSNINLSGDLIMGGTLTTVNITTTNLIDTNLTVGVARITSNLSAVGDSNTFGNLYSTGGNIGIGIVSPSYKLDVNGNVHVNANLYVDGLISGGTDTGSTFAYLTLTSTDDSINLSTGSLVTYGGITIQSPTDAESITNGGSFLTDGGASIGKRLFVGNGLVSSWNSNTIGNIYTTGGNVGIGTTSPSVTLDVVGSMKCTTISASNINVTGDMVIGGTLTTVNITTTNVKDTNISTGTINVSSLATIVNSNITTSTIANLLSTNISSSTLNVSGITAGNINFTGSLYQNGSVYISSQWLSGTGGSLSYTGGNVGIGTTSPQATLDVNGSARITNTTTSSLYVSSSTDVTNVSSASVVLNGGMGICKSLLVGGNVNVGGVSTQFSASFVAANNVSSATDITGFILSNSVFGSFTSIVNVKLVTLTQNLNAQYYIEGTQTTSGWIINDSSFGDDVGITFTITNTGQMQYTSSDQTGWISTTINYQVTGINLSSGYTPVVPTSGNVTISGNLNILSTTDANSASTASLALSGGLSVIKNIYVGGNVGIGTTSPGATLDVTGTARFTTSVTTGSLNATNSTVTNAVATTSSAGTVVATTYTGGNMSLSGNLTIAGTLTTVNITTTNMSETNVSAGTVTATNINVTTQTVGTSRITNGIVTNMTVSNAIVSNAIYGSQSGYALVFGGGSGSVLQSLGANNRDVGLYSWGGAGITVAQNTGYVGIGTTNPSYPLHVVGVVGGDNTWATSYYYHTSSNQGGAYIGWAPDQGAVYTIRSNGRMASSAFDVFSDSRIKKNIQDINDNDVSALETIRLIQPKLFNYIDTGSRGKNKVCGFIAQQVKNVLDYAVNESCEFIPDIYSLAIVSDYFTLTLPTNIDIIDIMANTKLRLIMETGEYNDVTITHVTYNSDNIILMIDTKLQQRQVFVYGRQVDDFHTLNHDAIFTVSVAALQEVDRQLQTTKNELQTTKNELQTTKNELDTLRHFLQSKFPGEI